MITIRPADSRYHANHGWLDTYHSFSFADYYDPDNMQFGPMRVLNDDIVAGHRGFATHPHREMEIVSIVLTGKLKHTDSTGQTAITGFGEVQRMSAGTGVQHSETNPGNEPVNLLQLWFMPDTPGLTPSYEATTYDPSKLAGALLPVVSNRPAPGVAAIHQDMTIYLSRLESGQSVDFTQAAGRRIYLFVMEGAIDLNGSERMGRRDDARITDTPELTVTGLSDDTLFMLIDLP
ncbi:pirin family protein [Gorillibacterium timonense]|uniref:pirin family protein n=1 Tax=Gorillibacterium timonense TaxID=1689269 RepID=UPI00071E22D9|nr:pirin family protein [Gorillibacterium timonense]